MKKRKIDSAYSRRQEKMPCKIRHVSARVGTRALSGCDVGEWQFWSSLKVSAQARVRLRAKDNAKRVVLVRPHVSWLTQVERGEKNCRFVVWLSRSASWTEREKIIIVIIIRRERSCPLCLQPPSPQKKKLEGRESVIA